MGSMGEKVGWGLHHVVYVYSSSPNLLVTSSADVCTVYRGRNESRYNLQRVINSAQHALSCKVTTDQGACKPDH